MRNLIELFERTRKTIFWFIDSLQGGIIKDNYTDIKNLLENASSESAKMRKVQMLDQIINHAIHHTVFYKNVHSKILNQFPVINKTIIRESFNDFVSDSLKANTLIPVITSGSTGTPFKTFQDKKKKQRNYADTLFFAEKAGYNLGDRLVYLKIWAKKKMKSPLHYWFQNIFPIDVIKLDDEQIESFVKIMEHKKSSYGFIGYASAFEVTTKYLEKRNIIINANIKSAITISESLSDYTRYTLPKFIGIPVLSRYSNLENGIIAQQELPGTSRYLINTASYVIEIFKMDSDEPLEIGNLGRIIITDLFNYAMPLIRYDTGDIGALEIDPDKPGNLYFSIIEGRKMDLLYDTKGNLVSSFIVYKNMWQYTEIIQYQLIQQTEKEYLIKISHDGSFKRELQLVSEFKKYLGEDAVINVEYVSDIPLLASGKRKKIVNNYKLN